MSSKNTPTKFRANYDADFKIVVVKYALQTSNKAASDHFGINESNVRRWKRLTARGELFENPLARRAGTSKKVGRRRRTSGKSRKRRRRGASYQQENSSDIGIDVRKKWRNLKDSYAKYLKSFSPNPHAKRSYQKWYWAKHLEFMRPHLLHMLEDQPAAIKIEDSMPLQQRLNTIASNDGAPKEEINPPPLKSQPLSPTKLKVTRQSTSKSVQEQPAPSPTDSSNEEVCLRWNSHHSNMQSAFPSLLSKEQYCDVTLVADGKSLKCHKLILSSCSSYFDQVLEKIMPYQHPVIFMKDIPFNILKSLCDFMYAGEVNIIQSDLDQLLAVAESLKIKGLANKNTSNASAPSHAEPKDSNERHHQQQQQHQKPKDSASSRFVKIAPKPTSSGVVDFKKFAPPKGGANGDVTDPLDLMEPTYEEEATVDVPPPVVPRRAEQARRSFGKRVRKRKHVGDEEHESSPPVFQSRKGTRSRPNVKVPRYFNASFDNSNDKPALSEAPELHHYAGVDACADPLLDLLEEIKTEPVDIEDGLIEESYDAGRVASTRLTAVVTKQEKEDAPDPLNVEVPDTSQHRLAEENSTERNVVVENAVPVEGEETTESTGKVALETPNNEGTSDPEENGQVVLSIAGTFSAIEDLPENDMP